MDYADILMIGTGDLGGWVVEFLARAPGIEHKKILIGDINEEEARKRTFSAWGGVTFLDHYPEMESVKIDLSNVDETSELLKKYHPKVVCNCTSLQSWWVVDELPHDVWAKMERIAGVGPWGPLHVTLTYKLMQAVQQSQVNPLVVNCSFPDLTNPVLGKVGLAPTCGIGNADHMIPGVRRGVAKRLNVPACNVTIYLVAHHSHTIQFWLTGKPGYPYLLLIFRGMHFTPVPTIYGGLK